MDEFDVGDNDYFWDSYLDLLFFQERGLGELKTQGYLNIEELLW